MTATATAATRLATTQWLATHRRLDALDVPAFGRDRDALRRALAAHAPRASTTRALAALPTRVPRTLLPLARHLAGQATLAPVDTATGIELMLRYLAAPIALQPGNPYPVHRACPSARCVPTCRLALLVREAGRITHWRVEADHHALAFAGSADGAAAVLGDASMALVAIAQPWALADRYGDFAPFNAMLEAGMAQAQALQLAAALGWPAATIEGDPVARGAAAALVEDPLDVVAWGLRLSAPRGAWQPPVALKCTLVATTTATPGLAARYGRLAEFAGQFGANADTPRPIDRAAPSPVSLDTAAARAAAGADLLALMRARHAGNDKPGLAPRLAPLPADARAAFLELRRAISARRPALPGEESLTLLVAWLAGGEALVDADGRVLPRPPGAPLAQVLQAALPYETVRHNLAALTCQLLWVADLPAAARRHGEAALRRLHLAAAAQAQDASLAATALGLFARPVRMLKEQVLEARLALPGALVYQVLCGLDRAPDLRWEL